MRHWIAGHRALIGLGGIAAFAAAFPLLGSGTGPAAAIPLALVALGGLIVLTASPYWRIVYRESPLRRAVTGITDLDERELELRDRAHGLAYFLFVTLNILLVGAAWFALRVDPAAIGWRLLQQLFFPYAMFAVSLPVILLEWFEPSGAAAAELGEDEA